MSKQDAEKTVQRHRFNNREDEETVLQFEGKVSLWLGSSVGGVHQGKGWTDQAKWTTNTKFVWKTPKFRN